MTADAEIQRRTAGNSTDELHRATLRHAAPRPGLGWIDVGCGTGDMLRALRDEHAPARLVGVDVLPWLDEDLRADVDLHVGDAPTLLPELAPADRVLLVETLEHLEAPWTTLRAAARLVTPGGRLVVSTPHVASLRHRLELPLRGRLTSFRPHELQHLTPALPHVTEAILVQEGLSVRRAFAQRDVIPGSGGRHWPRAIADRAPGLLHISVVTIADRPR